MKIPEPIHPQYDHTDIPPTLTSPRAIAFWRTVVLTGLGTGVAAGLLTKLLISVERVMWPGPDILDAGAHASYPRHLLVLLAAGVLTGMGQFGLQKLSSANGIDITEAITRFAGRLPALRTVGSALLSIVVVGMGASLGREGAPKQVGAVIANVLSDHANLSDEQRRLLVACGAGAGMAAAYGVPLGGALFGSLALGALLGSALGFAWSYIWPGVPQGLFAVLGAAAVLAATTHGPISSVVLIMELTARDRSFMLPLLVVVVLATLVSRTLDSRSIYDARFTDQEVNKMQRDRRPPAT